MPRRKPKAAEPEFIPTEPEEEPEAEPEPEDDGMSLAHLAEVDTGEPRRDDRFLAMEAATSKLKLWETSGTALRAIRSVPTIFPQFDRVTRVNGLPLERWTTIHGPSNNGKTQLALGLGASFIRAGHFFGFVDAERTTPITWIEEMFGHDVAHSPNFFALRPDSFEDAVTAVREFSSMLVELRKKPECSSVTGLIVIDSLRKLVPKNMLAKLQKDVEKNGVDGAGGRAGQIRAAYTAAWLDEVVPLMDRSGMAVCAIARESESNDPMAFDDFKVGGGKAVIYDAGLVLRVVRAGFVYATQNDPKSQLFGERCRIEVRKTKISGKEERTPRCYFHTSNGALTPPGMDLARDLLELATHYGIVSEGGGGWLSWKGKRFQGAHNFVRFFSANQQALEELNREVRAKFSPDEELPSIDLTAVDKGDEE